MKPAASEAPGSPPPALEPLRTSTRAWAGSRPVMPVPDAARSEPRHREVLWSAATAREIVTVIAEDADAGLLAPAEAVELIDRVWSRAAPS